MAVSAARLQKYVGDRGASVDTEYADECLAEAEAMVDNAIGTGAAVPDVIRDRCILECGSELYHRRSAPNGISQFATPDGAPVRVARDPLVGVYPLLKPYLVGIG